MIVRTLGKITAGLVLAMTSTGVLAYGCQGPIASVALNPGGLVTVSSPASGLNTFYVCQIGATVNGVGPEQCKAILSMLYVARTTGQQVQWQFNDGLTCGQHGDWAYLTGWYFGPTLLD